MRLNLLIFSLLASLNFAHAQDFHFFFDFENEVNDTRINTLHPLFTTTNQNSKVVDSFGKESQKSMKIGTTNSSRTEILSTMEYIADEVVLSFDYYTESTANAGLSFFTIFPEVKLVAGELLVGAFEELGPIPYKPFEWHNIKIDFDSKNNFFSIYFDGILVQSSKTRYNEKYLNFSINNILFDHGYIDNIDVKIFLSTPVLENDLAIHDINMQLLTLENIQNEIKVRVSNMGKQTVNSFFVQYDYNQNSIFKTFENPILPGESIQIVLDSNFQAAAGVKNIDFFVGSNEILDDNLSNNYFSTSISCFEKTLKTLLLEYVTGTWCGFCPAAIVSFRNFLKKYKENVQGVFIHVDDIMENDDYYYPGVEGVPSLFINKSDFGLFPRDFLVIKELLKSPPRKNNITTCLKTTEEGNIEIENVIDPNNNEQYMFISQFIVEDSIHKNTSQYNQSNFYSGDPTFPMEEFNNLPSTIPSGLMYYRFVPRHLLTNLDGNKVNVKLNHVLRINTDINFSEMNKHHYLITVISDKDRNVLDVQSQRVLDFDCLFTKTSEEKLYKWQIIYNNAENFLKIHDEEMGVKNYQLIDLNGSILCETHSQNEDIFMNVPPLGRGMYIVKKSNSLNNISVERFIKY